MPCYEVFILPTAQRVGFTFALYELHGIGPSLNLAPHQVDIAQKLQKWALIIFSFNDYEENLCRIWDHLTKYS